MRPEVLYPLFRPVFTGGVDGYTITWRTISRATITEQEVEMGDALVIHELAEGRTSEIGAAKNSLRLALEFNINRSPGDDQSTELNRALVDVERAMMSDRQCGGQALDTIPESNEFDFRDSDAKSVAGLAIFNISYRHSPDDPTIQV